jgi:hypothetical protein
MPSFPARARTISSIFDAISLEKLAKIIPADVFKAGQLLDARIYKDIVPKIDYAVLTIEDLAEDEEYELKINLNSNKVNLTCDCALGKKYEYCKHAVFGLLGYHPDYKDKIQTLTKEDISRRTQKVIDNLKQFCAELEEDSDDSAEFHYYFIQNEVKFKSLIKQGYYQEFADVLFDIRKLINNKNAYGAVQFYTQHDSRMFGQRTNVWEGIHLLIDLAHLVAAQMPLLQRIEWIEKWLSYPSPSTLIGKNFDTKLVFLRADYPEVIDYTNANLADKKKKLPKIFYEAHNELFGEDLKIEQLKKKAAKDSKYYAELLPLLKNNPKELQVYTEKYYLSDAAIPHRFELLKDFLLKLQDIGLAHLKDKAVQIFFASYHIRSKYDYKKIKKNYPQYFDDFCENSIKNVPLKFYETLLDLGEHQQAKALMPIVFTNIQLLDMETLRFYYFFGTEYFNEAFDFCRVKIAQNLPADSHIQQDWCIKALLVLYKINPEYALFLAKTMQESVPKHRRFYTELTEISKPRFWAVIHY